MGPKPRRRVVRTMYEIRELRNATRLRGKPKRDKKKIDQPSRKQQNPPKHLVEEAENQIKQEKEIVGGVNRDNVLWEVPEWQVSGVPPDFINVFSEREELLEKAISYHLEGQSREPDFKPDQVTVCHENYRV